MNSINSNRPGLSRPSGTCIRNTLYMIRHTSTLKQGNEANSINWFTRHLLGLHVIVPEEILGSKKHAVAETVQTSSAADKSQIDRKVWRRVQIFQTEEKNTLYFSCKN